MSKIVQLSEKLINYIGSGEIIKNLDCFIKESIENSYDANSTKIKITINIKNKQISKITIKDNGCGIQKEDYPNLCKRYYTSKINEYEDFSKIKTLGFRGEALNAISLNSKLIIISNNSDSSNLGIKGIFLNGDLLGDIQFVAHEKGTTLIIEDLFYKNSKRKNCLKDIKKNIDMIQDLVKKYSIHFCNVNFILKINDKIIFQNDTNLSKCDQLKNSFSTLKKSFLLELEDSLKNGTLKFKSILTKPNDSLVGKKMIVFINNRLVEYKQLEKNIRFMYNDVSMCLSKVLNSFFVFLEIEVNPVLLDFNISADKKEVKLIKEKEIIKFVVESFENLLKENMNVKNYRLDKVQFNYFGKKNSLRSSEKKNCTHVRNDPEEIKMDFFTQKSFKKSIDNKNSLSIKSKYMRKRIQTNDYFYRSNNQIIESNNNENNNKIKNYMKTKMEEKGDLTYNKENKNLFENCNSSKLLLKSTFIGLISSFEILLQYDESLIQFSSINFCKKYFQIFLENLIYNREMNFNYKNFEIEDFDLNLNYIKENFKEIYLKMLNDIFFSEEKIKEELKNFLDLEINLNYLQYNKKKLNIVIHEILSNLIDHKSIAYLLLNLFIGHYKKNLSLKNILQKFHLFLIFSNNSEEKNINQILFSFYSCSFVEFKKKFFFYDFEEEKNEIFLLLDIKSIYKIFERC